MKHRTKMATPVPSSTCCIISNIWIREMSSFLNMSAVSSSNAAVWLRGGDRGEWLIITHPELIHFMTAGLHFFILPHSAKQEGIWYNPWRSSAPCRERVHYLPFSAWCHLKLSFFFFVFIWQSQPQPISNFLKGKENQDSFLDFRLLVWTKQDMRLISESPPVFMLS